MKKLYDPNPGNSPSVRACIPRPLHEEFVAERERRGLSEAEAVRQAISLWVADAHSEATP